MGSKNDYQIRVHVIECRDLKGHDSNGMADPVCVVKALTKKQSTKIEKNTTSCTWDMMMFFSMKLIEREFFEGKLVVTVFDANTVLRDVEIGSYSFDVQQIYDRDGHELYRTWVALTDSHGKEGGIRGYLKLSITIMGPGEQPPPHEAEEEEDDEGGDDLQSMVLMPPSVASELHCMEVNCYRAENLPKMDTFGKCDGYAQIQFAEHKTKTEVVKKSFNPVWNQQLYIPVATPTMADKIKLEVYDWDAVGKNEVIGTTFFRYSELKSNTVDWSSPRWLNLYGPPDKATGAKALKMAQGFIPASDWKGRCLVSIATRAGATETKAQTRPITSSPKDPATTKYVIRLDLLNATELYTKTKVAIELSIGTTKKAGNKVQTDNGAAFFYNSFEDIELDLPSDKSQVPDIFLNLIKYPKIPLKSPKRVGYLRLKVADLKPKGEFVVDSLLPDFWGSYKEGRNVTGFLQYKLEFGTASELGARTPLKTPSMKQYMLRVNLCMGRQLPPADTDGESDPYCVFRLGKLKLKSEVQKNTLNPIWYTSLEGQVELPEDLNLAPALHCLVWDWDQVGGDDFLGRFSAKPKDMPVKLAEKPSWYPIYFETPKKPDGDLLLSFQLIPVNELSANPKPSSLLPPTKDYTVEVSAIGIRNFRGLGPIPLNAPWMEFDTGGTVKVQSQKSDKPNAKNANILETLNLSVKVPNDPLYSPSLNMRVFDSVLGRKTLMAIRSLHLEPFLAGARLETEGAPEKGNIQGPSDGKQEEDPNAKKDTVIQITPPPPVDEAAAKIAENMSKRDLPDVADSYPEGSEEQADDDAKKKDREVINHELEDDIPPNFGVWKLYRTKSVKNKPNLKIDVGSFKGRIRCFPEDKKVTDTWDLKDMYKAADYMVRIYCLEGYQLINKDAEGNDPYIKIKLAKKKVKDVQKKKQATSRPMFYKCYELQAAFPVETQLEVTVMDYDTLGSDDVIGSTVVDLENRFFSKDWQAYKRKPMEYRTLWVPSSRAPQGQLKMWVDVMTLEEAKNNPPEQIEPPKEIQCELRVIIWNTKKVNLGTQKNRDIMVIGYMEGQKPQSTDTHWRSENGEGMFNWRMKFPVTLPCPKPRFKCQVWDHDIVTPNDALAESNLNLRSFFKKMYKEDLKEHEMKKQWIKMTHPKAQGVQGELEISFQLLTAELAQSRPAGFGRSEPNSNPELPPPKRPETSFNPLRLDKMISKVLWKNNKWKIYGCLIACVVVIILILIIYFVI